MERLERYRQANGTKYSAVSTALHSFQFEKNSA
jgi:hypothetical protein